MIHSHCAPGFLLSHDLINADLPAADAGTEEPLESQRGISDNFRSPVAPSSASTGKSRKLYCFSCHRLENHYNALKGKSYHYLLVGITFGLVSLFGPYRCRCCGHRRLCRSNFLNLRYHYHVWQYSGKSNLAKRAKARALAGSSTRSDKLDRDAVGDRSSIESPGDLNGESPRRRRKRKLKAAPIVDSIGKQRRQREAERAMEPVHGNSMDYSIEGLLTSFETVESRKQKAREAAERAANNPFVAKKATPRKKPKGQLKRRYARKAKLSGPKLYCFGCKQDNEHFHTLKGTAYYFFFFGITFGLIPLLGPFRCSVCSRKRLFISNLLNPKYYIRQFLERTGNGYN